MLQIEEIKYNNFLLAVIVKKSEVDNGLQFPTPNDFGLQLGFHNRPKGEYINAHEHVPFENISLPVQEILMIKSGKILITLFHEKKKYKEITLIDGDIIVLNCGHSLKFLEDTKLVEVKQGPYRQKQYEKIPLE